MTQETRDAAAEDEKQGGGDANPGHSASASGPKGWTKKTLSLARKALLPRYREPRSKRCVVIGPGESGKTLLLMSLSRCINAKSHSYTSRYVTSIGDRNPDFTTLEGRLDRAFERGLWLEASDTGDCFLPEFTLRMTGRAWPHRIYDTRFKTFDGAGGLLPEREGQMDEGYVNCRAKLVASLDACDTVMICVPIIGWVREEHEAALNQFIDLFMARRRIRTLIVCFTMYEVSGQELGRQAYRELANRSAARERMAWALKGQLQGLDIALEQFQGRWRNQVWCVPVSTYGFIARNGGANVRTMRGETSAGPVEKTILRTIATPDASLMESDLALKAMRHELADLPYDRDAAYRILWRPFLTIDPFAFIASGGDWKGTLIHNYKELKP